MAIWRIWPSTSGPAITSDTANTDLGTQFKITASGCTLTAYYQWLPSTGDTTGSHYSFRLYSTTNGTTGTLISGSSVTGSGTLTAGAYNRVPVTAVALTSGTTYVAVITYASGSNHYGSTANYWSSGAGSSGFVQGPVTAPNNATSLGTNQSPFDEPSTGALPTSVFNASNYWLDVEVNDGASTAPPPGAVLLLAPGWHPGRALPGLPGGIPFAWAQTVAPGAVPPPPVVIPATPGTYSGIPGRAIPGLFIPGNPGTPVTAAVVTAAPAYAPAWHPGAGLPGMPGGVPFTWAAHVDSAPVTGATVTGLTDAGTGTDALAVTAVVALADAGTGADALAVTSAVPLADAGTGTDALAVAVPVALTDTGTGADTLSVTIATAIPLTDSGSGTDSLVVTVATAIALTDAGTAADSLTVTPGVPLADAGNGSDTLTVTATVPLAETGTAADALAVTALVPLADAGTAADTVLAALPVPLTDAGSGTDSFTAITVIAVPLTDSGSGSDTQGTVLATVSLADLAAASDAFATTIITVPFTVGALTASTATSATLTAAVSAAGSGAEYGSTYSGTYGPQEGILTATDTRTGGPG